MNFLFAQGPKFFREKFFHLSFFENLTHFGWYIAHKKHYLSNIYYLHLLLQNNWVVESLSKQSTAECIPIVRLHWIVCMDLYVLSRLHDIFWRHHIIFNMSYLKVRVRSTVHNSIEHGFEPTVVPHSSRSGSFEKPRIALETFSFWKLNPTVKKLLFLTLYFWSRSFKIQNWGMWPPQLQPLNTVQN